MKAIELIGLIFLTAVLTAIVIPIPCLSPSCGPEPDVPLTFFEIAIIYLLQPITWVIIISWVLAITIWVRRSGKSKD